MAWLGFRKQDPVTTEIDIEIPITFIKEGNSVIAYTPVLDISTCGENEAEAKKMFNELVRMFFTDLVENNTADEVLTGLGWTKAGLTKSSWVPPKISQESYKVQVPVLA